MIFVVIFMNDLIEYVLNYYINSSLNNKSKISSSKTVFERFFINCFATIHQYTTSWLF